MTSLRSVVALAALVAGLVGSVAGSLAQDRGPTAVLVTEVRGPITPVIADHLRDAVERAEDLPPPRDDETSAVTLLVELDTPGGLITSMRSIVQDFLNADVPVVVYVAPSGADAGSAGTFITLAGHVAAMAPATTIGAATPVDLEGGEVGDKIVNNAAAYAEAIAVERGRDVTFAVESVTEGRSVTADEALEIGAIDLIANSREELLAELNGQQFEIGDETRTIVFEPGDGVEEYGLSWARGLLQRLADPNLAFVFMSLGTLAIIYEVANPGLGAGGILGAVFLIMAFYSLSVLPVNLAGAALLVLAAALFLAELFAPGFGVAGAGGTAALLLGGLFLFDEPSGIGVDLGLLIPVALGMFVMVLLAARAVMVSRKRPTVDPADDLIGRVAELIGLDEDRPRIRLDGTWWRVVADEGFELGGTDRVEVVGRDNLDLFVRPAD